MGEDEVGTYAFGSRTRRISTLKAAGLLVAFVVVAILAGFVLAAPARAAVDYTADELAFVQLLNDYRVSQGLETLLISDMITEACDRHNSDMAKYNFFSHYTTNGSDWFAIGATPWDRMAASGYDFNTWMGENIAAGYNPAAAVFNAWKLSSDHNVNMLNANFKVIGVSCIFVSGSTYGYYWTTDFGGYVDATAHTVSGDPPPPTPTRYQQTSTKLGYAGTWSTSSASAASGGSFRYANSPGSSVTVTFTGTYLAWIARKSPVYGIARVTVDGGEPVTVDLYSASSLYNRQVWSTGDLADGDHTVKIEWTGTKRTAATGTNISVDAFDIIGTLTQAPVLVRYQQTDPRLGYLGAWSTSSLSAASGGSYRYSNSSGGSVTVKFTGTYLAWIARKSAVYGIARVTVDSGEPVLVDLYSASTLNRQQVWNTGTLATGPHTVKIEWTGTKRTAAIGTNISVDAFDVVGTLTQAPVTARFQQTDPRLAYTSTWSTSWLSAASGGSFRYTRSPGASITVNFTGTYLAWITRKSAAYGIARVTVDGGDPMLIDLYSATTLNQQCVWNTGVLANAAHTVKIEWTGTKRASASGTNIGVDAFDVLGTLGVVTY